MMKKQGDMEGGKIVSHNNKSIIRHKYCTWIRKKAPLFCLLIIAIFCIICAAILNPTEKEMVRYINKTGRRTKPYASGGTVWAFDGLSARNNYLVFSTFRLIYGDTGPRDNIPSSKSRRGTKIYVGMFGFYFSVTPGIRRLSRGENYPWLHWEDDDFEWPDFDEAGDPLAADM